MCDSLTQKKYRTRPSPPYPANKCCGKTKKGNDGNQYISVPDKNNRCRWVIQGSKKISLDNTNKKSWLTHDNGGRPYKVVQLSSKVIHVFIAKYNDQITMDDAPTYPKLVKSYDNVEKVFIGKSPLHGSRFDGNSVLLRLPANRYVFIGDSIYEFTAPEPITTYYSAVGNNDVPYPVALSKAYCYFMLGTNTNTLEYVKKTEFPKDIDWSDAYSDFYDLPDKTKIMYLKRKTIAKRII
jgi:hypothetical protein